MKQDEKETFGAFIKRCRTEKHMSLRGLASQAGIDSGALTRLEQNRVRQPKLETLMSLSRALDVPFSQMCAMVGYLAVYDLPSLTPYLRSRYSHLPEDKLRQADEYFRRLIDEQHLDPRGPIGGEDEAA